MTFKNAIRIILTVLTLTLMPTAFAESDAKRGITIDDLSAITDIKTIAVSPDGNYVAFQTMQAHKDTNDFTVDWYIATTTPGATPIKVGDGADAVLQGVGQFWGDEIIWSPDSEWIYFIKKQDDALQIWRSSYHLPEQQQLTYNSGDIQSLQISEDGSKVLFTIGRTRAEIKTLETSLSKQGFLQQQPILYSLEYGTNIPACTDGQGQLTLEQDDERTCRLTSWVYDLKSGVERQATAAEINALPDQPYKKNQYYHQEDEIKLSPDGTGLAWIENEDPETYKGLRPPMTLNVSMKDKNIICPARECINQRDVGFRGVWWHPNGKEIIFHVVDGPHNSLTSFYSWTPGEASVRTILRTDDYIQYGQKCDLTGTRLICKLSTWTSPEEIASIDLNSGKISTIVDVNPEFKDFEFTKVEKILGEDDYGHKVYAHLVYPKDYKEGQQYPLVITQYHSYGFLRGATGDEQPIHVYAQKGMFVLSFDHRPNNMEGAKRFAGHKFAMENVRRLHIKQSPVIALENMVEALVDRGIIDPKLVGISGLSYGSMVLQNALLRRNYAAASAAYSVLTSVKLYPLSSSEKKIHHTIFGGDTLRKRKFFMDANAGKIDTPYLLQIADREFYMAALNYSALKNAGKPVEMYVYPDELHVKWQPAHKYIVYSRNLDWFNFWLQGIEDPDPAKAEQYARWRELREMHEANLEKLEEEK